MAIIPVASNPNPNIIDSKSPPEYKILGYDIILLTFMTFTARIELSVKTPTYSIKYAL